MLATNKVMAFVATTDAARARAFYEDTLGLRFVSDEPYAVVFDAGGTMLRIQKATEVVVPPYTTLGWHVDDIAVTVAVLAGRGVTFLHVGLPGQDQQGVWTVPGGSTKVVWFKDPDGHTLSLTELAR